MGLLKQLKTRWDNWTGDRDLEIAIRKHLTEVGYFGRTATIQRLRLVAVQRPGWLQVSRFEVQARVRVEVSEDELEPEAEYHQLFGLARDDLRHKINDIRVFDNESDRKTLFQEWSQDLICLRGAHGLTN